MADGFATSEDIRRMGCEYGWPMPPCVRANDLLEERRDPMSLKPHTCGRFPDPQARFAEAGATTVELGWRSSFLNDVAVRLR